MSNVINYSNISNNNGQNKAIVFDLLSCHFFENVRQNKKYIDKDEWNKAILYWADRNNLTREMLIDSYELGNDISYLPTNIAKKFGFIPYYDKNEERLGIGHDNIYGGYLKSDINLLYFFKRLSEFGKVNIEKIKFFFKDTIKDQIFKSFLRLTYLTNQQRVEYQDYNLAEFIDVKNYDDNIIEFKRPIEIRNHSILTLNTISNIPANETINYEIVYNY